MFRFLCGIALCVLLAAAAVGTAFQDVQPPRQDDAPARLKTVFFGNKKACGGTGCHERTKPLVGDEPQETAIFSRLHELSIWSDLDKHKDASIVLTKGLGKDIAQRLGIPTDKIDLIKDKQAWKQCLTCHGVYVHDESQVNLKTFAPEDRLASGVSCVVCHGPHPEWVLKHTDRLDDEWQRLTRRQKEAKYGLRDLWDPVKRATLCASCHVGSAAEGKVVTHEMYAAGHPPLPGFELTTFSDSMPRHWEMWDEKLARYGKTNAELLDKARKLYRHAYQFDPDAGQSQQAQHFAVGAAVAFRESMKLMAAQAAGPEGQGSWPEFAAFDCYACHHDLKHDSWRQRRGYALKPGRPEPRTWPLALLQVAMVHADGGQAGSHRAAFDKHWRGLMGVCVAQPFGDAKDVHGAAQALVQWSEGLIGDLEKAKYPRSGLAGLLKQVTTQAHTSLWDFDSARQLAWAAQALAAEDKSVSPWPHDVLEPMLKLKLPVGQQLIAGAFLNETMQALRKYDAVEFQRIMKKVAGQAAVP